MDLGMALDRVLSVSDDLCIFAKKPWSVSSEAEIATLGADYRVPAELAQRGLEYFLDIATAREVLEALSQRQSNKDEKRGLLLFYAENDAFPDWIYRR